MLDISVLGHSCAYLQMRKLRPSDEDIFTITNLDSSRIWTLPLKQLLLLPQHCLFQMLTTQSDMGETVNSVWLEVSCKLRFLTFFLEDLVWHLGTACVSSFLILKSALPFTLDLWFILMGLSAAHVFLFKFFLWQVIVYKCNNRY